MKIRYPDRVSILGEMGELLSSTAPSLFVKDVSYSLNLKEEHLICSVSADTTPLCFIKMEWHLRPIEQRIEPVRVLGDAWERAYADLEWQKPNFNRLMPWYTLVSNGSDLEIDTKKRRTECFGVMVRPSALCAWQYDLTRIVLTMDIRCGSKGVLLCGRTIRVAEIFFSEYTKITAYESGRLFCRELCRDPIFPKQPVYGFNNWYYAYGQSSAGQILEDTRTLTELCRDFSVAPYMVIDDGWQQNNCDGPWDHGNERFSDMKGLADRIRQLGAIPGIWIRPLYQKIPIDPPIPQDWFLSGGRHGRLDPSRSEVLDYIGQMISRLKKWGYGLIKYDYTTHDLFDHFAFDFHGFPASGEWAFYDRTKTSAEIILALYQRIRKEAGDAVLIGCNTISHLCAGLVEINRTGDDVSGKEWERTRKMGLNSLAFRAMQNKTFYLADADCAPITGTVPWEKSQQWLELLSVSETPLFVSWDRQVTHLKIEQAIRDALKHSFEQADEIIPLDWMEQLYPSKWIVNGKQYDMVGE